MRRPARTRDDEGSILVLTLGLVLLVSTLVAVVVDASAVFLARRSLAATCDAAALDAAQGADRAEVYAVGGRPGALPLRAVEQVVGLHAAASGAELGARVEGGTTVVVEGERPVSLPFTSLLGVGPVTVTASARAEALRRDATAR